ncbi:hypothetical protein [Idiomarina loihiensis]|uniref:hypothetical protein n=1 Tax=Idiomarina loihiensis TaxID=135577 RepID=UPI0038504972
MTLNFSDESRDYLTQMGIDPYSYQADLSSRFNSHANLIDSLINSFGVKASGSLKTEDFNSHIKQHDISDESEIYNHAYDIFNYIRLFKGGGRFGLFKGRQPEWEGPVVTLHTEDVPESNLEALTEGMPIYRGMSEAEFNRCLFGQSWTTNIDVAKRFAKETYNDMQQGIVAKTCLDKKSAIYHSETDSELEVIMAPQSVVSADRIET